MAVDEDDLLLLLLLLILLLELVDDVVVGEGIWIAIGAIVVDDASELTDGTVDFGKPKIGMLDTGEEETEGVRAELDGSLDSVVGLPYSVVLAPMTMGIAMLWMLPSLSVKDANPVVVVVPSAVSELWEGRLRLLIAEDGIGFPLALQAAWKGAMSWLGSSPSSEQLLFMHEAALDRKPPEPARLQIPSRDR